MTDSTSPPSSGASHRDDLKRWRALVEKQLGSENFDSVLCSTLPGGIAVEALTGDQERVPNSAGFPGLGCQTRGGLPLGPPSGCMTAPLRDEPSPSALNQALLEDLEQGAPAAHILLDKAARLGLGGPQEDANARGLVLGTTADLKQALRDVWVDAVALSFDAGANARPLLDLLQAGDFVSPPSTSQLGLQLGMAPLSSLARDGSLPGSLSDAWDDCAWLVQETNSWAHVIPLALDSRPWHEAGCDMPLELGLLLAEGAEFLRALEARDIAPEVLSRNLVLRVSLDPDVFPSIAFLRAARRSWSQMLATSGVEKLPPTRLHAFEGARSLSVRDPWVNLLRTTTQAFAAQVAGADAFTPLSYDRALGAPGRLGRRIARNTPNILQLEGQVARVLDPAGGSGHVEALTDSIARRAWSIFGEIEAEGGLAQGLETGRIPERIAESHAQREQRILAGDPGLVGVALYPPDEVAIAAAAPLCERLERAQAEDSLFSRSEALQRGTRATCPAIPLRRDAAPFEEQGVAALIDGSNSTDESRGASR